MAAIPATSAFDRAAANANATIAQIMGRVATYVAGTSQREVRATPGDVQSQTVPTGRGIEIQHTCTWLVRAEELTPLLGGERPRRGHALLATIPGVAKPARWQIEAATPDLHGGWHLVTTWSENAGSGARGAEAVT
jgi:hypothetical protein